MSDLPAVAPVSLCTTDMVQPGGRSSLLVTVVLVVLVSPGASPDVLARPAVSPIGVVSPLVGPGVSPIGVASPLVSPIGVVSPLVSPGVSPVVSSVVSPATDCVTIDDAAISEEWPSVHSFVVSVCAARKGSTGSVLIFCVGSGTLMMLLR